MAMHPTGPEKFGNRFGKEEAQWAQTEKIVIFLGLAK
jgi:hypothetical protein